jgi:Mg-chelatase subunit ChlD
VAKLGKDDCFGLVMFDSQPTRVVKLATVTDPAAIMTSIDKVTAGGGTEIFSALDVAYDDLRAAKGAKRRSVLLLTDGQAPQNGIRDLVETMSKDGMHVSAIGLGSGVDQTMLRMVADTGSGRALFVARSEELPKAFDEELARLRK